MRIVTNHGSNIAPAAAAYYGIEIAPQRIVVNGTPRECPNSLALEEVDRWVSVAKEYPHVVGTTAAEFVQIFTRLAREDSEIIAIMTSKKIIQTHAGAMSAAKALSSSPQLGHLRISVVDSKVTDAGAALMTFVAGEAARMRIPMSVALQTLDLMASRGRMALGVRTLDNLVKGGRASFLRAWLSNALDLKPVIEFVDGELRAGARVSGRDDMIEAIINQIRKAHPNSKKWWLAVVHANVPDEAKLLEKRARASLDVEYVYRKVLSPSIYLHVGPRALGLFAFPMDDLPWLPSIPPNFSE